MISPTDKFIEQVNECTHAPTQTEGKVTQINSKLKLVLQHYYESSFMNLNRSCIVLMEQT